jgi:hypothetical protein
MRYLLWCLIVALLGFPALAENEYLPIAVGNEWKMKATLVSPTGELSEGTAHRKVEGTVEKDGKTYFRSRTSIDAGPMKHEYTKLHRKDEKAFYFLDESKEGAAEQVEIVLPLKVGTTWQRTWGSMSLTETVVGIETVTISGKAYENCYHIRVTSPDGSYTEDYWEAPNVGSVKSKAVYGNGGKVTLTLKEFKSGK